MSRRAVGSRSSSSTASPGCHGWTGVPADSKDSAGRRASTSGRSTAGLPTSQAVQFRPIPGIDEAAEWLRAHKPRSYRPGIMHGDYQFANVMFRHGAPARLAAIVDWEMATVGDPLLDLGWVINGWPADASAGGESTVSYVDYTGMPSADDLLSYYEDRSGRPVDEIDYYVILARFKLAIVLEAGYARVVAGTAANLKMAAFGDVVLEMARKAADLAGTTTLR